MLSGTAGVFISNFYHLKSEKRRCKLDVLVTLLGNRNDITGNKFSVALNSVFVIFNDSSEVLKALKAFHESILGPRTTALSNQKLLDLFKAMCKNLDISVEVLTDNFFMQPFNTIAKT